MSPGAVEIGPVSAPPPHTGIRACAKAADAVSSVASHSVWGGRPLSSIRILSGAARFAVATLIALAFAAAPAHALTAQKRLTTYVAGEQCAPVKPLTEDTQPSSGSVTKTLPKAPAGQKWRIGFAVSANGFVVRIFLGDEQVGSGLIRWDRSYRFTLGLKGYDLGGTPVDISGRLEGCDIFADDPVTKVTGSVDGPVTLAEGIQLLKGTLLWDSTGMRLSGEARIACATSGALRGSATVDYRGADTWTLNVLGSSDGPTCVMEDDFAIGDATIGGTITATNGAVDGKVTGRANVSAPILPFGPWAATFELLMSGTTKGIVTTFSADAESEAGFAKVTIGADGNLVITLNLKGGTTSGGDEVPSTGDAYVDPASLLPQSAPVAAAKRCKVPKVKRGATLTSVRKALKKANCAAKVKRVRSKKVRKGRVVGTVLMPGKQLRGGAAVTVRVSTGS